MGQNPLGRRLIVSRQVGLGDRGPVAHSGPQHLVGAGDRHPRHDHLPGLAGRAHGRRRLFGIAHLGRRLGRVGHLGGRLVFAQALERRLPQRARFGIAAMLDLGDQHRLDPMNVLGGLGRALAGKGRPVRRHVLQGRNQRLRDRLAIAGSDPAQIAQTLPVAHPDQQRAEPRSALRRPAADHHLVAAPAFGFQPGRRPPRMIGRVQFLGDHPFQIHPTGTLQHRLPGRGEMFDVAQAPRPWLADPVHIGLQPRLAMRQRQLAQILRPFEQQVEGEIDQAARLLVGDRGLQRPEVRHVIIVQRAQFAVDHRIGPDRRIRRQVRETVAPVQAFSRPQHRPPAADADLDAVAVELDLVRPTRPARRMVGDLAQLDRDEGWRLCRLRRRL